ncbi:MAG: hypothetical protein SFU98_05445 [Leptospiraceae bacterium]|nr:hypothetical protein [Leptospiraceae bacterium]
MEAAVLGGMIFLGVCFVLGAFIFISVRIFQINPSFITKILKYLMILFIWLFFSAASIMIGLRIDSRHNDSYSRGMKSVNEIWGGSIVQDPPTLTYAGKVTEEYQNTTTGEFKERVKSVDEGLAFESQKIFIKIHKNIRQKGLLSFPGYNLDFVGTYKIKNIRNKVSNVKFYLALPLYAGNITDISIEMDGKPYKGDTNLANGVDWSGLMNADEEHEIKITYKAQGTGSFSYSLAATKLEIKELLVQVETDFTHYTVPDLAMVPSTIDSDSKLTKLNWNTKNLITGQNISLSFEIPGNYGKVASKLYFYSPLALLLFVGMIVLFTVAKQTHLHPMQYLFLIASFTIFYLLGSYLISYMSIILGILTSLIISTGIMLYYAKLINKGNFLIGLIGASALIFQWFFSIAFFFPEHTGLLITIASVLAFIGLLKSTAEVNWEEKF